MNTTNTTELYCPIDERSQLLMQLRLFVVGSLCLVGMFLNVNNMIVLSKLQQKSNSTVLLSALAYIDFLFLFFTLMIRPVRYTVAWIQHGDRLFRTTELNARADIFYYTIGMAIGMQDARNLLIVLITLERLVAIKAPFWSRAHVTKKRLLAAVGVVFIVCCAGASVWYFCAELVPHDDPCADPFIDTWWNRDGHAWMWDFNWYFDHVICVYTVLVTIGLCNILLIYEVFKMTRERSKMTGAEQASNKQITVTVTALTVIFFVCEAPTSCDRILYKLGILSPEAYAAVYTGHGPYGIILSMLKFSGNVLVVVDSSVNFFAYCLTNRSFRNTFLKIWCGERQRGGQSETKTAITSTSATT